jgi:hypothetical protein
LTSGDQSHGYIDVLYPPFFKKATLVSAFIDGTLILVTGVFYVINN